MTEEVEGILEDLRTQRLNCICLLENNNITDDTYKGAEVVANLQTAITGILEEKLLELQLKQVEEDNKKNDSGGACTMAFQEDKKI